ncbi:MAG: TRAP transporter small permease [Burkholderiaceae bacterium]
MQSAAGSGSSHWSDAIEETFIAATLGAMTLITFANVIARYVFNTNILWALEATVFLFAWMVLIGASYGVKKNLHIGIDILVNAFPERVRRAITLLAVLACIVFCVLLLKGSWDYWWPFATKRSFMETNDVPLPDFMQFLATWFNEGERYEKLPRFIPYFCLPLGMLLLLLRFLQAGWRIATGRQALLIAAHEAESVIEAASTDAGPTGRGA